MSELTNALNRIWAWLQTNYPEATIDFPHGLTLSRLEEILSPLPFRLPQEVYKLYQQFGGHDEERITNHGILAPH